jgi:putative membrane protein
MDGGGGVSAVSSGVSLEVNGILRTHERPQSPDSGLWKFEATAVTFCAAGLVYLLISGQYLRFVTPRMQWCLFVLVGFFAIWGIDLVVRKPRLRASGIVTKCLVVLLPALLILVPHSMMSGSSFDKFGGNQPLQVHFVSDSGAVIDVAAAEKMASQEIPGVDVSAKTITVSQDNFGAWYDLLQTQPTRFKEYKLTLTGFVHRIPTMLAANQFVVARPLMTCCIEDISAFGLTSQLATSSARSLGENSWVTVSGTLSTTTSKVNGAQTALLKVTKVAPSSQVTGYFYR